MHNKGSLVLPFAVTCQHFPLTLIRFSSFGLTFVPCSESFSSVELMAFLTASLRVQRTS